MPGPVVPQPLDLAKYRQVESSSQRGKTKLVDPVGHTYTIKKTTTSGPVWRCTKRAKALTCKATVIQRGSNYVPGSNPHCHPPDVSAESTLRATMMAKNMAVMKTNRFKPSSSIVKKVVLDVAKDNPVALPKPVNLQRMVNRKRKALLPPEPQPPMKKWFVDTSFTSPGFILGQHRDTSNGTTTILMATDAQLFQLAQARTWYMDGTFRVVRYPFYQLFSIHAFLRTDGSPAKQVPLAFAVMMGKTEIEYCHVLRCIIKSLPTPPKVEVVVTDFERAIWNAVRRVLGEVELRGCSFHWSQCVWKKVQALGLQVPYMEDRQTHHFLKKIFALPYLPSNKIVPALQRLQEQVSPGPLQVLMEYLNSTWLTDWRPRQCSVYGWGIRTNNDVEGGTTV